ncbi:hypothetical protein E6O75_ATG07451 [Venturia nashicola]|uniref:Uncharacterized protein n=1 Tax=Venturia nashicola TaxID=86259 RepID=A0A4Z1NVL1_9PEZI|nr:hypothetical protein E6O75_ATG07451 [Venturia nashicola]
MSRGYKASKEGLIFRCLTPSNQGVNAFETRARRLRSIVFFGLSGLQMPRYRSRDGKKEWFWDGESIERLG